MFDPVTATVLMGGVMGYGGYQAKRQADIEKKAAEFAVDAAKKQESAAATLREEEAKKRAQSEMSVFARRRVSTEQGTRRDTILTSPLGAIEQPVTSGKTLLGS